MTVISRLFTGVALSVLAASLIAPVTGSSAATDLKVQHAKKAHHDKTHPSKSAGLASRGRHAERSGKKQSHCGAAKVSSTTSSAAPTSTGSKPVAAAVAAVAAGAGSTPAKPPTTKPSTPPAGSGGSGKTGKAGLTWTNNWIDQGPYLDGASWCYNWSPTGDCSKSKGGDGSITFMPMFWGSKSIGAWEQDVMGKSWEAILGHNEPNIGGQGNTDPGTAASQWRQYIEPVNSKLKCSPAVTSDITGLNWMKTFMADCADCQIDAICIHHYDITAQSLIDDANKWHAAYPGKPIWLTEIGCMDYYGAKTYCTEQMVWDMMKGVKNFVDSTSWMEKWAWYQFAETTNIDPTNKLMNGDGSIAPMGKYFLGQAGPLM